MSTTENDDPESAESAAPSPVEQVRAYMASGDYEGALQVSDDELAEARRLSEGTPDRLGDLVEALRAAGMVRQTLGEYDEAVALFEEALATAEVADVHPSQLADINQRLAVLHDFNQQEEAAIPLYETAIRLYESMSPADYLTAGRLRNNLAMIYKGLEEFDRAEQHYLKAVEAMESSLGLNSEELASVCNNLGNLYYKAGFPEQARELHDQALEIRRKVLGDRHPDVGQSYSNLANVLHVLGEKNLAKKHFETGLRLLESFLDEDQDIYEIAASNYCELLRSEGEERKANAVEKRMHKLLQKHAAAATA